MSYKDGILLLASFEDNVDDDDLTFQNISSTRQVSLLLQVVVLVDSAHCLLLIVQ